MILNVIFDDACSAKPSLTVSYFFPSWMATMAAGLGISMAGRWSGMDDDKI